MRISSPPTTSTRNSAALRRPSISRRGASRRRGRRRSPRSSSTGSAAGSTRRRSAAWCAEPPPASGLSVHVRVRGKSSASRSAKHGSPRSASPATRSSRARPISPTSAAATHYHADYVWPALGAAPEEDGRDRTAHLLQAQARPDLRGRALRSPASDERCSEIRGSGRGSGAFSGSRSDMGRPCRPGGIPSGAWV